MVGHKLQMLMLQYVLDGLKLIQTLPCLPGGVRGMALTEKTNSINGITKQKLQTIIVLNGQAIYPSIVGRVF